jgi:3,4-dihydroxy 2-butanone 4-phosphate synthase/GTP cyclohydrolase II
MTADIFYPVCARIPTYHGEFKLCIYHENETSKEHLALVMGDPEGKEDVLVRVHSECFTGDVFGSLRCDCGEQLERAMAMIAESGEGVIIYLRQEGRGIGLEEKLRAYNLQDEGYDTVEANLALGHQADERDYTCAARILENLGIRSIALITNNPSKIEALNSLGINICRRIPLSPTINPENMRYLSTKAERMRHLLDTNSPENIADASSH